MALMACLVTFDFVLEIFYVRLYIQNMQWPMCSQSCKFGSNIINTSILYVSHVISAEMCVHCNVTLHAFNKNFKAPY